VDCNKDAKGKAGPVVDDTEKGNGEHHPRQTERPHEKRELEKPGDQADQKRSTHRKIDTPFGNLPVHDNNTRFLYETILWSPFFSSNVPLTTSDA
jgi:hypothetical protein